MWSWWDACIAPSSLGLVLSSASTIQADFVLRFPLLLWVSPLLFIGILQGVAANIGTSNFLRAALIVRLNSSSFGLIKNVPPNCLALSSFGFSMAHRCFAFFFDASDICFDISGFSLSGREVVCFLVNLFPDHVFRQVTFRPIKRILWSLSMPPTILYLHQCSHNLQYVSPTSHL